MHQINNKNKKNTIPSKFLHQYNKAKQKSLLRTLHKTAYLI